MSEPQPESPSPERPPELSGDQVLGFVFLALALVALAGGALLYGWATTEPEAKDPPLLFRVNVNTADEATLQLLPGVGPALAQRIVEERKDRPFTSAADLERVSGIGPKLSARMKPYVAFDLPPEDSLPPP